MVNQLLQMDAISKALPKRVDDVVLGRLGKGVGKSSDIGSKNIYTSYVSFGTNDGTFMGSYNTLYKRILRADEPAIPIDLICSEALVSYASECEVLTLPMQYEVMDSKTREDNVQL